MPAILPDPVLNRLRGRKKAAIDRGDEGAVKILVAEIRAHKNKKAQQTKTKTKTKTKTETETKTQTKQTTKTKTKTKIHTKINARKKTPAHEVKPTDVSTSALPDLIPTRSELIPTQSCPIRPDPT
jgi:hypothetical protein